MKTELKNKRLELKKMLDKLIKKKQFNISNEKIRSDKELELLDFLFNYENDLKNNE